MRVVEGDTAHLVHAYIITGNGSRDLRILKAIAEKYDHSKTLRVPQTPIRVETGLIALARTIVTLADKPVRISKYLAIIDREHVSSLKDVINVFKKFGLEIISVKEIVAWMWLINVRRGPKNLNIYLAVLGIRQRIEENLARLIELIHGERVEGTKEAVNKWLKEHGLEDIDLIREAPKKHLEEAFPTIVRALKDLITDD